MFGNIIITFILFFWNFYESCNVSGPKGLFLCKWVCGSESYTTSVSTWVLVTVMFVTTGTQVLIAAILFLMSKFWILSGSMSKYLDTYYSKSVSYDALDVWYCFQQVFVVSGVDVVDILNLPYSNVSDLKITLNHFKICKSFHFIVLNIRHFV